MKLHAFGDSFTVGDQDDFDQFKDFDARLEYLRYNVSYISIVASELGYTLVNHACRGSGNFPQIDKLWNNFLNNNITSDDLVFFAMSTSSRDRSTCIELKKATSTSWGECVIDREMLLNGNSQQIHELDYFYVLSVLDQIRKKFNIKIIIMQAFDQCLDKNYAIRHLFNFEGFIGCNHLNNTFINILNDTWANDKELIEYGGNHLKITIPPGYDHLYTEDRHPSIEGHKKIAQWLLKNVEF